MKLFMYFIKASFRNMRAKPLFSIINFFGLTIGLVSAIIISIWAQNEFNFDAFHKNQEHIYQIVLNGNSNNADVYGTHIPTSFGPAIQKNLPDILSSCRFFKIGRGILAYKEEVFSETRGYYSDQQIFDIFSFPLKFGNSKTALQNRNEIVLTEKLATKYFGDKNPIGEIIKHDNLTLTVCGVVGDLPENSQIQFDYLVSIPTLTAVWPGFINWNSNRVATYLLCSPNADINALENKMGKLINDNSSIWQNMGYNFKLKSFNSIYLDHQYNFSGFKSGDKRYVLTLSLIGVIILLIAFINFINLYEAQRFSINNDIGVQKVFGASRKHIIIQFLSDSSLYVFISTLLAIFIVSLSLPYINNLFDMSLSLSQLSWSYISNILIIIVLSLFLTGIMPAISFSRLRPIRVMSKNRGKNNKVLSLRNALVVLQFFIAIVLIISSIVTLSQRSYIMNKKLGFESEHVVYLPRSESMSHEKFLSFKEELLKNRSLLSVSSKTCLPYNSCDGGAIGTTGMSYTEGPECERCWVALDYFKTLNIEIAEGRSFSKEYSTDGAEACILNRTTVRKLSLLDPLGKEIFFNNQKRIVIGVINDVLTKSLHESTSPQIYLLKENEWFGNNVILIKMAHLSPKLIDQIKKAWNTHYSLDPFEYTFLDDDYQKLYVAETRLSSLFQIFAMISVLLSALGILGISSAGISRRTKEIGIRKVNGAKTLELILMLNKGFLKLVLVAFIIACPIAYYAMSKWLENFAYKTELSWWIFALAGIIAMGIALLTVSFQSYRAATRNPVESLRSE